MSSLIHDSPEFRRAKYFHRNAEYRAAASFEIVFVFVLNFGLLFGK